MRCISSLSGWHVGVFDIVIKCLRPLWRVPTARYVSLAMLCVCLCSRQMETYTIYMLSYICNVYCLYRRERVTSKCMVKLIMDPVNTCGTQRCTQSVVFLSLHPEIMAN